VASDLGTLMVGASNGFSDVRILPYPLHLARIVATDRFATADETARAASELAAIGRYLLSHPQQLWVRVDLDSASARNFASEINDICRSDYRRLVNHDECTCLGLITTMFRCAEIANISSTYTPVRRRHLEPLLHLSVPDKFRQLILDWMEGKVKFVVLVNDQRIR
jgi:hypothetical protein